ncbi:MAG: hypothetical protein DRG76_01795 [Deltaproteobacteria bacterium]|nr:MAG: hypothetical protein DRG76_01795 [Deltaproteobacteria bacterium]
MHVNESQIDNPRISPQVPRLIIAYPRQESLNVLAAIYPESYWIMLAGRDNSGLNDLVHQVME